MIYIDYQWYNNLYIQLYMLIDSNLNLSLQKSEDPYFLRSNTILEYHFWYRYHILHRKDNVFISKYGINILRTWVRQPGYSHRGIAPVRRQASAHEPAFLYFADPCKKENEYYAAGSE